MIVAMACNKKWYKYLVVDIYSLLKFSKKVEKIYLLVETDNINKIKYLSEIKKKFNVLIEIVNFNNLVDTYVKSDSPNVNDIYTNFCFAKLILGDVIKEDKVLYLDTDTIVRNDISNLWNYDISDYYIAGVRDHGVIGVGNLESLNITGKYINSGVVLYNLSKIRNDKIIKKWFKIINNYELRYPDQDALNYVCQNSILYLPSMYNNANTVTLPVLNKSLIKIFHYACEKEFWVVDKLYAEEWYDSYELFMNEIVNSEDK